MAKGRRGGEGGQGGGEGGGGVSGEVREWNSEAVAVEELCFGEGEDR